MYSLPKTAAEIKANVSEANNKSSSSFNNIEVSAKYALQITTAEWITSTGGANGITLHLTSDDQKEARVTLYYTKKDGSRNDFSANKLDALMVTCGVKNLTAGNDSIMKWSKIDRAMVEEGVSGCPELKGKWFTGLIQIEKDAYMKEGIATEINKHNLFGIFQAKTDLSANEIMNKETIADEIHECLESLEDFPIKYTAGHKQLMSGGAKQSSGSYGSTAKVEEPEDDLPW